MIKQLCQSLFQHTKMLSVTYKNGKKGKIVMDHATNVFDNFCTVQNYCTTPHARTKDVEAERIVWMDLEMTGLDVDTCHIMEIACIVTDGKLNIIAEGPDVIIKQPPHILDNMNEWCINQHGKTGLTDACKNSTIVLKDAEKTVLDFIQEYTQPGMSPLAGNSVYMDRLFLKKYMPEVENYLHYRIIDVSTIKELCRRWNPEVYKTTPKKQFLHRSLQDIKESIEELKWYRENFMKITDSESE